MRRSRADQELPGIESNANPHILVRTGFKNNIDIMKCLVVMGSVYNVDSHKVLLCCAILLTSYLDKNGQLRKVKKATQMINTQNRS